MSNRQRLPLGSAAAFQQFITTFLGYGSLEAKNWMIGIEEGGGKSREELMRRVAVWVTQGASPTLDLHAFHQALGISQFFGPQATLQKTWARLSQMLLVAQGLLPSREAIRAYQSQHLGRQGGDTLLAELMPLPKPSQSSWPYGGLAKDLPFLKCRKAYLDEIRPQRVEMLRQATRDHRPERVVFYGKSCLKCWKAVADVVQFRDTGCDSLVSVDGSTTYFVIRHPNAHGLTNEYFAAQGRFLRDDHADESGPTTVSSPSS